MTSKLWSCCDHMDTINGKIRVCSANVGAAALKKLNVGYVMEGSKGELSAPISHFLRPFVIELPNTFSCRWAIKPPWHWSVYEGITPHLSHAQKHQVRSQRIDKPIEVPGNNVQLPSPRSDIRAVEERAEIAYIQTDCQGQAPSSLMKVGLVYTYTRWGFYYACLSAVL